MPYYNGFVTRYIVYILLGLLFLGSAAVFWISYQHNRLINEEIAIYEAGQFSNSVARFRTFYSETFVPKAQKHGLIFSHDYQGKDNVLPLPATMMMDFSNYLAQSNESNYKVRLYSDLPFPWREDSKPQDDFERWAIQTLKNNPEKPVWRFENHNGMQVLRYARADRLTASCIGCHNSYPGTPKTDWKEGDVSGVLEVSRPLSDFEYATKKAFMESFFMLLGLSVALLTILLFALRSLKESLQISQASVETARIANQKLLNGLEERERLAEDLKAGQIKNRTIIDSVLDAIIVINAKGIIIETNESVFNVMGYTPDELLGENVSVLMYAEHAANHDHYLQHYLKTGEQHIIGRPRQLTIKRKDGTLLPVDLSVNEAKLGDSIVFTGVLRDISHRLQSQQALAKARDVALESARLKSEFLANMSHEIRTPMNGIIGMTELLLESPLNRDQREQIVTIQSSADSLLRIINDILDFSKIEAGKLTITNNEFKLLPFLESILELLAESAYTKNLEVALFIEKDIPNAVIGDAIRLRQILLNLLNNAIKFTERGHVLLKVSKATQKLSQSVEQKCLLKFEVSDTGCGIIKEAQNKLFTAFSQVDGSVTRQHGGTGLGLAICKQLAHLMGGDVGVISQLSIGSTFWVTITVDIADSRALFDFNGACSLLMLNTRPNLNQYYERQFRDWGIKSIIVNSINNFMAILDKIRGFDFVMIDADIAYHRPEHPLGMLTIIQSTREYIQIPIFVYANTRQVVALESLTLQHNVFLLGKPLKYSAFLNAVKPHIHNEADFILEPLEPLDGEESHSSAAVEEIITPITTTQTPTLGLTSGSTAVQEPLDAATAARHSIHVLLTEDHIVNQKVALAMLRKMGIEQIDCALNGEEAVQAVQHQYYDLILMDCQMPVLDGYEATQQIRQLSGDYYHHLPIIALTAHAMKGDDEKCYLAGMDDYLSKPVRFDELKQKVDKWLAHRQTNTPR